MVVGLIGAGFVGSALAKSFELLGQKVIVYDKYKQIGQFQDILQTDILFLCLPSLFIEGYGYDLSAIQDNCRNLHNAGYAGLVVLKSTVEPGTTQKLEGDFGLRMAYNPEFLTQRTAFEDFHHQKHIVLGFNRGVEPQLYNLYQVLYPNAQISISNTTEAEAMKVFCNSFYAIKVMVFNEFYFLSQRMGVSFERIKEMMFRNGWINPMHTTVPGPDGQFGYGGACFVKDTNALDIFMERNKTPHKILSATIEERNTIRKD